MAYWFHRNPLKSTTKVTFDLKMTSAHHNSVEICSQLRKSRRDLIELMSDPSSKVEDTEDLFTKYVSVLLGFTFGPGSSGPSKLRHLSKFKWTQMLLGNTPLVYMDSLFELISVCQEFALWLTKHAAMICGKEDPSLDDAKRAHTCLRKAAGIFRFVDAEYVHRLLEKPPQGSDLDARVASAFVLQCTAEAQEITIARAIELKHTPSLISALAYETSQTFLSGASAIKSLDPVIAGKWIKYMIFKSVFYEAYAYVYQSENLLAQEKCGDAIRAVQESERRYEAAVTICKEYEKFKGPGKGAKPQENLFFRKLLPLIRRTKEKCIRENGMIFHHKVPDELLPLEKKATHGLVAPEEFTIPTISSLWTHDAYDAFTLVPNVNFTDPKKKGKKEKESPTEDLPPVDEKSWKESTRDPKNESGCVLQ